MDDLTKWLGAQLDEDARAASSWHTLECDIHAYLEGDAESVKATMAMFHAAPGAVCDCDVPARVLREVDAKRKIVNLMSGLLATADGGAEAGPYGGLGAAEDTLHLLALAYADRPGFNEEWRR
ncbi:DUF6221 family protein [Streptomyces sp. VRA16 Mangrove soil]|uniref:DUF6221 family protein n=1 Tax=Streptomyces sp. VRA16 Mangrove soil TaxID=2817434 RepID=UPI001A9D1C69|nr:DUF6221 family protein [Streptomyces sp. VRA16 Mangrove soil]MBO1337269.1 hypothetical protein [Streptomyces sp. VRA16 Mangrove soil]